MSKATRSAFKRERIKHYRELRRHEAEVEADAKRRKRVLPAALGDTLRVVSQNLIAGHRG